ncbi:F0F1 ATP synthase subunit delta [Corynebacterium sp. CCM 9185]|uniref:ATP synthase subunit delta n=1 Tax=Corynebacterium marambiense TaxID=2765364 RepID=A0ABS0VV18_9CORY|nr:F0F1 ATP synthase subunit delta [Corynebacterium marambiense]MBI9000201.1 F0F1 ATP synthase subunit delta [Corynebacterium marambiense]MCK7663555.1 F0F1 ATP synthase subunit delta [Corynebacterium marambiense]
MHAASREALAKATRNLDTILSGQGNAVATAAQTGTELFDVVEILDGDRALRVAAAEVSNPAEQRVGLVREVFGGKISDTTLKVLGDAVELNWSTPREMREGLVELGRRALLEAARSQGQLEQVEDELFRLSRILTDQPRLTQLLDDRTATADAKRGLLAGVLYGKVTPVTEALALQAITRRDHGPVQDIAALSVLAADMQNRTVAHVVAATQLTAEQEQGLKDKLGTIYGREMSIHSEVDPSLLGGVVVRVGSEVIDGSTSGKIQRLRSKLP